MLRRSFRLEPAPNRQDPQMTLPQNDIVDLQEVADRLSISPELLKRMISSREFPEATLFESGVLGWPENVVDAWIANRPRVTDLEELRKLLQD